MLIEETVRSNNKQYESSTKELFHSIEGMGRVVIQYDDDDKVIVKYSQQCVDL